MLTTTVTSHGIHLHRLHLHCRVAIGSFFGFATSEQGREERCKTASHAPIALVVVVVVMVLVATEKGPVLMRRSVVAGLAKVCCY